jgi:hypothetical protein
MATIEGRIIRIIDTRTVIINLGRNHGITDDAMFSIMGEPEEIVDSETGEMLGEVTVVKARVRANEVADRFTIATTKWSSRVYNYGNVFKGMFETKDIDAGELAVDAADLEPWTANTEHPVRVGDLVRVPVSDGAVESVARPDDESDNEESQPTEPSA